MGKIIMNICGSYRRGKRDCGDVDILLTHPDNKYDQKRHSKKLLNDIIDKLGENGLLVEDLAHGPVKYMGICRYQKSEKKTICSMPKKVDKNFLFKIPTFDEEEDDAIITLEDPNKNKKDEEEEGKEQEENKVYFRRIDLKFINYKFYFANLLYFTGSDRFNVEMRLIANQKHLILNENGVYTMLDEDDHTKKSKDPVVQPKCEKDIFDALGMEYVEPEKRSW